MRTVLVSLIVIALSCVPALAQSHDPFGGQIPGQETWFGTFSIIAFDPATNQLGVGVQSRAFGAGAIVPWVESGVGAVATQAAANRTYGPKAIALLKQGLSPEEVIKRITDEDPGRDTRQVAVIDVHGRMAAYTGARVIGRDKDPKDHVHYGDYSGSIQGKNYSVQGNTLASPEVLKAMAAAWENTQGTMAERLLAALEGGQSKGGDSRGMQSGGLIVVQPVADLAASLQADRVVDIRVDDHENPFQEMRRILNVRLSGNHTTKAAELAKAGKLAEALAEQKTALQMNPKNEQIQYMLAVYYSQSGDVKNALTALTAALKKQPRLKMDVVEEPAFNVLKDNAEFKKLIQK